MIERRGKLEDLDRSFDLQFWQTQTPQARFSAAWELIVHASELKGVDVPYDMPEAQEFGEPPRAATRAGPAPAPCRPATAGSPRSARGRRP